MQANLKVDENLLAQAMEISGIDTQTAVLNFVLKEWTCSGTPLVPEQVLHFFGLKPCKNAFLKGNCSETEVSEQL